MSKILDQLKSTADSSGRCHVRVSDSMTYGPVALSTVCQWAAQGRVTSESEISFDREQWVRADHIPELGLDWIAVAESMDSFGPFNLQALSQLVRRGIVAPDAQLKHRETGETLDVTTALDRTAESRPLDAAAARLLQASRPQDAGSQAPLSGTTESTAAVGASGDSPSAALVTELRRELAAAQDEGNRLKHRLQVESEGWNELKGELSRAREDLAEVRARHQALQEESDAREIEQGGRIAELMELLAVAREGRARAESEKEAVRQSLSTHSVAVEEKELGLEAMRARVEEVEAALAAAHDRGATLEGECARLKSDSTALAGALEEAVAQQTALQITLEKRNDEIAFLDQAVRQAALKATERITHVQHDLDQARATLAERQEEITLLNATREDERSAAANQVQGLKKALAESGQQLAEREAKVREELGDLTRQLTEAREVGAQREMESGLVVDTLKADMAAATEQLAASASRLQELEVENGALRSELEVVGQDVAAQKKQAVSMEKKLANRDEKIKGLNKELKERESALKSAIKQAQDADARLAALETELATGRTALEQALSDTKQDLEILRSEHEAASTAAELGRNRIEAEKAAAAALKLETEALTASVDALTKEVDILRGERDAKEDRVVGLTRELDHLKAEFAKLESLQEAKVTEHVDLRSRVDEETAKLAARVAELAEALGKREAELAAAEQKLQASDAAVAAVRAEAEKSVTAAGATHGAEVDALKVQLAEQKNASGVQAAQIEALVAELAQAQTELSKPLPAPEPPQDWYLRYDDEHMLGPVAFDVLVSWAKDCRVAHDHDVSSDRVFWAKAADVAGLEMEWMVTLADGTEYGPINRLAVKDLIVDGVATEDADLRHCRTGETLKARDIKPE